MSNLINYSNTIKAKCPNEWKLITDDLKSRLPELPPYNSSDPEDSHKQWVRASHQRELMLDILKSIGEM